VDAAQSGGGAIAIYGNALYITGVTTGGYPVTAGAFQTAYGGQSSSVYSYGDAFIDQLCINLCEAKVLGLSYSANTTTVCTNTPVKFTPAVSNSCDTTGYKFHWTFTGGNPASSDSMKPTITFPVAGSYSVKLMLTTDCKKIAW
jgi:PKD repeat protein